MFTDKKIHRQRQRVTRNRDTNRQTDNRREIDNRKKIAERKKGNSDQHDDYVVGTDGRNMEIKQRYKVNTEKQNEHRNKK